MPSHRHSAQSETNSIDSPREIASGRALSQKRKINILPPPSRGFSSHAGQQFRVREKAFGARALLSSNADRAAALSPRAASSRGRRYVPLIARAERGAWAPRAPMGCESILRGKSRGGALPLSLSSRSPSTAAELAVPWRRVSLARALVLCFAPRREADGGSAR